MLKGKINVLAYAGVAKPNAKMSQALGPLGINVMMFCKDFNAKTAHFYPDTPIKIRLFAYTDRTYKYLLKGPPTSWMLKKALGVFKGTDHHSRITGTIGLKQIYEIGKIKQELDFDMKGMTLEGICKCIIAQCQTMNILVVPDEVPPTFIRPDIKA